MIAGVVGAVMEQVAEGKSNGWREKLQEICTLFGWEDVRENIVKENLADLLEDARQEWNHAKLYFNNVTDPDLIDHAIFYMGATEKKYNYLLKQARETGLNVDKFHIN